MTQISNILEGGIYGDVTQARPGVVTPAPRQALNAVHTLRRWLDRLELPGEVRTPARWALDEMEDELRMPDPDRGVVTARLERFTELLADAGAFASADESPIRPIRAIATWLGPIGAALVGRLA